MRDVLSEPPFAEEDEHGHAAPLYDPAERALLGRVEAEDDAIVELKNVVASFERGRRLERVLQPRRSLEAGEAAVDPSLSVDFSVPR
jgi:hypothetical protein